MNKPFLIVLEQVRSAYNVGSVLRTVDALGSDWGLVLVGITPPETHPKVRKTALGAEEHVSVTSYASWEEAHAALRKGKYKVYAVEAIPEAVNYTQETYQPRSAFVFGNEIRGVTFDVLQSAHKTIAIPMRGRKTSLNVATSVGVIGFEVNRQQP